MPVFDTSVPAALLTLTSAFAARGVRLYLVGGAVRNPLLGLPRTDLDITGALLQGEVLEICGALGIPCAVMSTALGTLHIRAGGEIAEYTPFRAEAYARGGAHRPETVRFGASITEDAARRDFTVNALYLDCLTNELTDPLGGMADIQSRTLRQCRPDTLESDALRILRLVRFAGRLGFSVAPETMDAARRNAPLLADIAPERRREELTGILLCDAAAEGSQDAPGRREATAHEDRAEENTRSAQLGRGEQSQTRVAGKTTRGLACPPPAAGEAARVLHALGLLETIGAWPYLIPALTAGRGMTQRQDFHRYTVLEHAFHAAANTPPALAMRLAGLLHDVGKPESLEKYGNFHQHDRCGEEIARAALETLRYPKDVTAAVCALVRRHMFDIQGTAKESTVRLRFATWGREESARLILLREADIRGCGTDDGYVAARWRALLGAMLVDGTPFSEGELAVDGREIMETLGLRSGERVGQAKAALFAHCARYPADNTKARLLAMLHGMRRELRSGGGQGRLRHLERTNDLNGRCGESARDLDNL